MIDTNVMEEYFRIYKPWEPANNCCFLCKKSIDGCSWSKDAKPVEGWKAAETKKTTWYAEDSYKIYYCPEFEEGDASEGRELDEDRCFNLIEEVYRNAADDYKKAYKRKLKAEWRDPTLHRKEIKSAESIMLECSFLLGEWTDRLKKMVERELALEEGDADG